MTINNLIGYDPLAWMDGETLDETIPEPAKKVTKSRAKAKSVPVADAAEVVAPELDSPVATIDDADEAATEEMDIDITVDEDGDIKIAIEADENIEVAIEIATESPEIYDPVMDEVVEEISEMPMEDVETDTVESEPEGIIEPLIELGVDATLKNIAALYGKVKQALAVHDTLEINASDVATVDTATLQLLVSLKKDTSQSNKTVDIIYPSARFIEAAKLLNLLDALKVTEI